MEYVVAVLQGEIHYILLHLLAITHACCLFLGIGGHFLLILLHIAVPELTACPRNILLTKNTSVVGDGAGHRVAVDREDMVVLHDILVTIVVFDI